MYRASWGVNADPLVYVYQVGIRPGVTKGVEFLLDAVSQLRRAGSRFHLLLLLGTHPPSQYRLVVKTIARLGLEPWITIRSSVSRPLLPGHLLGADCVVVPSLSEGFGYSAIEAAQLGCPLIATRGNSLEEVVGGYAVMCPAGDAGAMADTNKPFRFEPGQRLTHHRWADTVAGA